MVKSCSNVNLLKAVSTFDASCTDQRYNQHLSRTDWKIDVLCKVCLSNDASATFYIVKS